ncbi:Glomulin, partial [Dufourea novaeangliae]
VEKGQNAALNFTRKVTDYMAENKFKEASDLFEGGINDCIIKETSRVIIQRVSSYIESDNVEHNEEAIHYCTKILNAIVEKVDPSETILRFLEELDTISDIKFSIILRLVGRSISKMADKSEEIKWSISTLRFYIGDLAISVKESEESTIEMNKTVSVYNAIILFLDPLVQEVSLETENTQNSAELRYYLLSLLIFLMGEPLCHLQDHVLESQSDKPLPEKIISLISRITGDLFWCINIVSNRSKSKCIEKKHIDKETCNIKVILFELNENVPDLAYANLYFYIVTKLHLWETVPQVYNWQYIFEACTYLIVKLLQEKEIVTTRKGLNLMSHLLNRLTRHFLTLESLEVFMYSELLDVLMRVMIYCDSNKERRKALELFREYLEMFDMQARYHVVTHLYQTCEHSGLLSLTTGILKDSVIKCLQTTPPTPYFLGKNLESLLKLACKLPHGSESDLVEISDEIITSLNLLRFLFLRDQHNQTGIWNCKNKLKNDFLTPLRKGINLCRTHWKVKIKDLEEQRKTMKINNIELEKSDADITLTVGGEILPPMPVLEKISFCHKAVNGLDVMENVLIRVNECI